MKQISSTKIGDNQAISVDVRETPKGFEGQIPTRYWATIHFTGAVAATMRTATPNIAQVYTDNPEQVDEMRECLYKAYRNGLLSDWNIGSYDELIDHLAQICISIQEV